MEFFCECAQDDRNGQFSTRQKTPKFCCSVAADRENLFKVRNGCELRKQPKPFCIRYSSVSSGLAVEYATAKDLAKLLIVTA